MAQTRKNRILPLILVLVCAAVMLRSAFTGLEIDEEYALSLGYRLVSGDRLFYDMWEPHQLSSLPAAALLAMFIWHHGRKLPACWCSSGSWCWPARRA